MAMFDQYATRYIAFADMPDRVCLSAALVGEMPALPAALRRQVDRIFATIRPAQDHPERGVGRGEFLLSAKPAKVARLVFSALQGVSSG
jgi:TetR/AcrR family transcriptional regulator, transcriptional repressor for nem operon